MKPLYMYIFSFMLVYLPAFSQLTIEECYEKAKNNYPLIHQYELIEKSKEYNLSNVGKGYLPQIQLSAKATYQSDATKVPVDLPGVKGLSKDQYGATIDISQTIWDGGTMRSKKTDVKTQAEVDGESLEVTLYTIRNRVNQLYFGILLHEAMLKQNVVFQKDLQRNYDLVTAYVENGIANQADVEAIKVEQIKVLQQQTEWTHNRKAYLTMLSALIGEDINDQTTLIIPVYADNTLLNIDRPELSFFDAQIRHIEAQKKQVDSYSMPSFNLFITSGYGKPGLNLLKDKFSAYYLAGVRMVWNFGSLYTRKNSLQNIETARGKVNIEREAFLFNTRLDMINSNSEIQKIRKLIKADEEIISLRSSIRQSAEAKFANGTLSALDLMKEVNAEQVSKESLIMHEIQLIQAIYNLRYITNN